MEFPFNVLLVVVASAYIKFHSVSFQSLLISSPLMIDTFKFMSPEFKNYITETSTLRILWREETIIGLEIISIVLPNPRVNKTDYALIFQILLFDIHKRVEKIKLNFDSIWMRVRTLVCVVWPSAELNPSCVVSHLFVDCFRHLYYRLLPERHCSYNDKSCGKNFIWKNSKIFIERLFPEI